MNTKSGSANNQKTTIATRNASPGKWLGWAGGAILLAACGLIACIAIAAISYTVITRTSSTVDAPPRGEPSEAAFIPTATWDISTTAMFSQPFAGPLVEGAALRLGKGSFEALALSPDGNTLAVATRVGIYIYDAQTYTLLHYWSGNGHVFDMAYSPDGCLLVIGDNLFIFLWDVTTGQELPHISTP